MKRSRTQGRIFRRGEAGFNEAVLGTSFNAREPGRRPDIAVQANDEQDVVAAVKLAKAENLKMGICSGGHSWAQNHIRDGGLMLDLSRLNSIEVDSANKRAIVGPGAWGGEVNAAVAKHGLFFPVAHALTVGIGGFLLQGGFGWNSRQRGLGCENVVGLDLVLADGSLVHADAHENADLFWAARGSGPGFFAVVVRFYLKLHARPKAIGLKVQVFRIRHLEEVLSWADKAGPSVPAFVEFQMVFNRKAIGIFSHGIEIVAPVLADSWREAKEAVAFIDKSPLRPKASLTLPLLPMTLNFMMKTGEKTLFLPDTRWRADNMWMNGPIEPLLPALRRIVETQPPAPSHVLWLNWNGPAQREDMAFSVEGRTYLALYGGLRTAADETKHADWATSNMRELEPFSAGIQLADENTGARPARFLTDQNMARLREIRAARDPEGRFHSWMGTLEPSASAA